MIRFATHEEIATWNMLILSNPNKGGVFQGYEFSEQKRIGGWTPRYIVTDEVAIMALEKTVPILGRLWYISKGPDITSVRQLDQLLPELKQFAKEQGIFLIKTEPELHKSDEAVADLLKLGFVGARSVQPSSTVLLDISPNLDEVLARLNQKSRHAIRRAERDGVTTKLMETTDENCEIMFNLLKETAAGSFGIRSYLYYKSFWQRYSQAGLGQLFFAYFDGQVVACAFAIAFGAKGTYKDGASVRERPAYGASHLLQWRVIEWMKTKGVTLYDFCGTPPSDQINNPEHPYYGFGRFKTSFHKEVTDYVGVFDYPIKSAAYKVWTKIGEKIVRRLHLYLHHENYY